MHLFVISSKSIGLVGCAVGEGLRWDDRLIERVGIKRRGWVFIDGERVVGVLVHGN